MTDKELDLQLKKGKHESGGFFSHTDTDALRRIVIKKTAAHAKGMRKPGRARFVYKTVLAAAGIAAAAFFFGIAFQMFRFPVPSADVQGTSAAEQPISLGQDSADYMVSFFPVNQPYQKESGLMSVLWEMRSDKTPSMIYSSLFERCDEPYPVSTVGFPGRESVMLLIASGDRTSGYIHYRLIGLDGGSIITLLSQDFVPQGKLDVSNGIVVEERHTAGFAGNGEAAGRPDTLVSYIVPCRVDENGELLLPVSELKLRMGDRILLVGEEAGGAVMAVSAKGLLLGTAQEAGGLPQENGIAFEPLSEGEDTLSVKKDGNSKHIAVKIEK